MFIDFGFFLAFLSQYAVSDFNSEVTDVDYGGTQGFYPSRNIPTGRPVGIVGLWIGGMMEYWVSKTKKRYFWFRNASLEDHFAEAQGKIFLAFSLKSGAGGRSSNLYQGNTYP